MERILYRGENVSVFEKVPQPDKYTRMSKWAGSQPKNDKA